MNFFWVTVKVTVNYTQSFQLQLLLSYWKYHRRGVTCHPTQLEEVLYNRWIDGRSCRSIYCDYMQYIALGNQKKLRLCQKLSYSNGLNLFMLQLLMCRPIQTSTLLFTFPLSTNHRSSSTTNLVCDWLAIISILLMNIHISLLVINIFLINTSSLSSLSSSSFNLLKQ